jgi:hypothetical protein
LSYVPISLLDTIGKLFEKILLSRILSEISWHVILRHEQIGFRPKHSTSLYLARFVERVISHFGDEQLSVLDFFDVTNAFDTVWVDGLLFKAKVLIFRSYLVNIYPLTFPTGRSSPLSKRPHVPVVACVCAWRRGN